MDGHVTTAGEGCNQRNGTKSGANEPYERHASNAFPYDFVHGQLPENLLEARASRRFGGRACPSMGNSRAGSNRSGPVWARSTRTIGTDQRAHLRLRTRPGGEVIRRVRTKPPAGSGPANSVKSPHLMALLVCCWHARATSSPRIVHAQPRRALPPAIHLRSA